MMAGISMSFGTEKSFLDISSKHFLQTPSREAAWAEIVWLEAAAVTSRPPPSSSSPAQSKLDCVLGGSGGD
jgi:hypothetical protein